MDLETLKRIGKDIDEPSYRRGKGNKKKNDGEGKLPRASKCNMKGSSYCRDRCSGDSYCPKHIHAVKELAGYTLVQSYMGVATTHPEWVGKWRKL